MGAVNVEGPPPKQGSPRSPYCPSASTADYEQKPLPMGGSARAKARLNSRGLNRATGELSPPTSTQVIAATAGKSMWPLCLPRVRVRHASPDRTVAWYCCRKAE